MLHNMLLCSCSFHKKIKFNPLTSRVDGQHLNLLYYQIPPLENDGQPGQSKYLKNDNYVNVPDIAYYELVNELSSITLTPAEIDEVLKSLPVGKSHRTWWYQ